MIENNMVRNLADDPIMNPVEMEDCQRCGGTGKIIIQVPVPHDVECNWCNGTGQIPKIPFTIEED